MLSKINLFEVSVCWIANSKTTVKEKKLTNQYIIIVLKNIVNDVFVFIKDLWVNKTSISLLSYDP